MRQEDIFAAGLGLKQPWKVDSVELKPGEDGKLELHIDVSATKGSIFEVEGESCSVYDHRDRSWRHLNFFQHVCYLHARVPRVKLSDGKVRTVEVPWAQAGSSFTLLFEYSVVLLVKSGLSISAVSRLVDTGYSRIQNIINQATMNAIAEQPLSDPKQLGIDETSTKKGHTYFTVVTDLEARKVVGIATGKSSESLANALLDIEIRDATTDKVKLATIDMSTSYIKGVTEYLPTADIVFDRFHLAMNLNKAVDKIRKSERKKYEELKNTKYLWLKNNCKLSKSQKEQVDLLSESYPTLGQAYRFKELFRQVLDEAQHSPKLTPLNNWIKEVRKSGITELIEFTNMLHTHWYGIKTYFKYLKTNAISERINLKIQEIKRTARGYRNDKNFMMMIYFHLGGLKLGHPH